MTTPDPDRDRRTAHDTLLDMVAARPYIDFPTGWALQDDQDLPPHDPRCSTIVGHGAFLCDCDAVLVLWCQLRDQLGLPVPDGLRRTSADQPDPPATADASAVSPVTIPAPPDAKPTYDTVRAARAAGFEDDVDTGREVARRFHKALLSHRKPGKALDPVEVWDTWTTAIADIWQDADHNPLWLSVMANAFHELWDDFAAQVHEARGLPR